jgi:general secretion pathway protein N
MARHIGRCFALISLVGSAAGAATPQGSREQLEAPPNMPVIELRPDLASPPVKRAPETKPSVPSGNPLWSIPLSALTATRERPVFSPSRRPPAPAVVNVPFVPAPRAAAPPPPPPRPNMVLVGTITGDDAATAMAIFVDQGTKTVIRLRPGDAHLGWTLESVRGRAVIMQNGSQRETYDLPKEPPHTVEQTL